MPEVSLFVLSDLHATDARFGRTLRRSAPRSTAGKPSWLDYSDRLDDQRDPLRSLLTLIRTHGIHADYLVLPGDICDKANGAALVHAWRELELVRAELGASLTIATAGNHDLDSRYRANPYDPREALLQLLPDFPLTDSNARAEFWAYGVTELTLSSTRFVVVNSCAQHGGAAQEIDHGRFAPVALARLRTILERPSAAEFHVLLCHHHPHPLPLGNAGQDDRMIDGEVLLDALDETGVDWLLIHGHRHMARLLYAGGSAGSPAVLAAGSASVRLDPALAAVTRNQAHLLRLTTTTGSCLRGTVDTWNYNPSVGWEGAGDDGGLPRRCGFGYRGSLPDLAERVESAVRANGGPLPWEQVITTCPDVEYLTPRDFARMRQFAERVGIQLVPTAPSTYEATPL